MHRAQKLIGDGKCVVVSDVRFEDEAQAIRDAGGVVGHVRRQAANKSTDTHGPV